jgi:hypothetical protein
MNKIILSKLNLVVETILRMGDGIKESDGGGEFS